MNGPTLRSAQQLNLLRHLHTWDPSTVGRRWSQTATRSPSCASSRQEAPLLRHTHLRDQHRHAQVLEAAGVGVAALLDPQVAHAQLLAKPAAGHTQASKPHGQAQTTATTATAPPQCPCAQPGLACTQLRRHGTTGPAVTAGAVHAAAAAKQPRGCHRATKGAVRTARPRTGWSCPQTSTQCRRCSAPATSWEQVPAQR